MSDSHMKPTLKVIVIAAICVVVQIGFGQSTFIFRNYAPFDGVDAPVFDAAGNRLFGTHYVAMLYGGPTADSLAPARSVSFEFQMAPVPFTTIGGGQAGYFGRSFVQFFTVPCGGLAWLEVRAWDLRLGPTYEAVQSLGLGGYGESNLFQKRGGINCGLGSPPEPLIGLQSFALRKVIPEPCPVWLLLLGLPSLLFLRRGRWRRIRMQGSPSSSRPQ